MRKAIYAGSFDPVTLGHLDIIERASKLFDCLVVAVLENPNKHSLFTVEERKVHLEMVTKHLENVEVALFEDFWQTLRQRSAPQSLSAACAMPLTLRRNTRCI